MNVRGRAIFLDRVEGRRANRTNAFLPALSKNADRFGVKIDIFHVERGEFAQTQTAAVKKFHYRDIAQRHPLRRGALLWNFQRRDKQFFDLLACQDERQLFVDLRKLQLLERIDPKFLSTGKKFIESAQRRELQSNIRTRLAALHDDEEIIAEIVGRAFFPGLLILRAESSERLAISLQRSRRRVALDREVLEKFFRERVARAQLELRLRFFDYVTRIGRFGPAAELTFEDRRGVRGNDFVIFPE